MRAALLLVVALLSACDVKEMEQPADGSALDQCLRATLLRQCLAEVLRGPTVTSENPWHKVVAECQDAATLNSYRIRSTIKPECRAGGRS